MKVLVTPRSLSKGGHPALDILTEAGCELVFPAPGAQPSEEALIAALPGAVAWLAGVEPITAAVLNAADKLRIISRNGVGVDNIDHAAAKAKGIVIATTPGANSRGVAELAFGFMLSYARQIPACDAAIKAGGWERRQGIELAGKTLGIVGCGQIGRILARMASAFDMTTLGFDLCQDENFAPAGFCYDCLDSVLERSDFISLHLPSLGRPILDAASLAKVRPGVCVVNTARSSHVDEAAMLAALDSGRVACYATDVFAVEPPRDSPLARHPKVIATPHAGGYTAESVARAAGLAARNIVEHLRR